MTAAHVEKNCQVSTLIQDFSARIQLLPEDQQQNAASKGFIQLAHCLPARVVEIVLDEVYRDVTS